MRARFLLPLMLLSCGTAPIVNPKVPDQPSTPELVQREPDLCGAAGFQGVVGHPRTDVAQVVAAAGGIAKMRVIPFGSIITQDYDAARVNFMLDAAGLVLSVSCG